MRKFAYPLLYIALACFTATIFVNLVLGKGYIAVWVFLAAVFFLIFGIASLITRNTKNTADNRYTRAKTATTLIYVSTIIIMLALLLMILHFRIIGREMAIAGLLLFIAGIIIAMLSSSHANKTILTPTAYRQNIMVNVLFCIAVICMVGGLLLKLAHFPGATLVICAGIILYIAAILIRLFTKTRNTKY